MGWGPPQNLSHVIRDELRLKLSCACGHATAPDIYALRAAMWRCCGGEDLDKLPRLLKCSRCGSKQVKVELSQWRGYTVAQDQPVRGSSLMQSETRNEIVARLRALTVEDAAEVLADAEVSDPLSAEDVFAFYNWMLDRVIGEEP